MPDILAALVERLYRWGVLPKDRKPDFAIVNIDEEVRTACTLHHMQKGQC